MKKLSDDLKYFFSGSIFLGLSSIYSLIIPLIIVPYIIKTVSLSNYGLSVVAFSVGIFLSIIVEFGYTLSGVNMLAKSKSKEEKGKVIALVVYTKTVLFFFILSCFFIAFLFIPYLREHYLLFLYSLCIPLSSIFNLNWALQGIQKIKTVSLMNILNKTVYLVGIFLLIKSSNDYVLINFLFGLGILISGVVSFYIIGKEIPIAPIIYNKSIFFNEVKTSGSYFVTNISVYFSMNAFPVILSFFVKNEIVGIYSIIEKIYNLLRAVFVVFVNLMLPRISNLIETSIPNAIKTLKKTYIFVVLFVLFEITVVRIFNTEIIYFFTKQYIDLSINLLNISLIGIILVVFNCPFYILLVALDKRKEIMKTFLTGGLIAIALCFLLSNFFSIYGTIYALIIMELFYSTALIAMIYARRHLLK